MGCEYAVELATLIRIQDLRRPLACGRALQGIHAESVIEPVRNLPGQGLARVLVHDGDKV